MRIFIEFIFCCDSNFGMFDRDIDLARFAGELHAKNGYPKAFSVQNAKNATDKIIGVQEELAKSGLNKGVTLALQSASSEVLENINRKNIPFSSFSSLQHHFTRKGIETYTDIILCLPGETRESFVTGVDTIVENGQYNRIQFINLSILPNSEMGNPDYIERFGLETVEAECISIYGAKSESEVREYQRVVVASKTMPREDWAFVRSWSWMCSLVFFDKLLQIPLTLLSSISGLPL